MTWYLTVCFNFQGTEKHRNKYQTKICFLQKVDKLSNIKNISRKIFPVGKWHKISIE